MWPEIVIINLVLLTGVGVGFLMGWILKSADLDGGKVAENRQENQG